MARLKDREIAHVAKSVGFSGKGLVIAIAVALAESGGDPAAINDANTNGSTDYGLYQINSIHSTKLSTGNWSNPYDNAKMAKMVWSEAGNSWSPWVAYTSGSYRIYLVRAEIAAKNPIAPQNVGKGSPIPSSSNGEKVGESDVSVSGIAASLSSADTWKRIAMAIAGAVIFIIGIFKATGDNKLSDATKSAASFVAFRKVGI